MIAGVLVRAGLAMLDRLLGWLPFIAAYVAGRRSAHAAALEIAVKVKNAQLEIAARARVDPGDLIARMRRDGAI
mgnify:CR=1 FL=1